MIPRPATYRVRELDEAVQRLRAMAIGRHKENMVLARNLSDLQQEHDALWRMLCNVSHELRTPMNGIIGYSDLLLDTTLDDTQQAYVQLLKISANHLLNLVNNVLDWSSLSSGAVTIDCLEFNLRVLVEDVADTLAVVAEQKSLTLASIFDREVPATVLGDPQYLRQILLNLVGNAIKFTDSGEVVVAVAPAPPPDNAPNDTGWLRISVSDTGPGIAREQQRRIFERFARIQSDRPVHGTGLGLSIARDLVEQMSGRIGLNSIEGGGASFWLDLPLLVGSRTVEDDLPPVDISGMRVLVADANATYRRILSTMLSELGARCKVVADGRSALAALTAAQTEATGYDVLIMDLLLSDMDGAELARRVHKQEAFRNMSLVVLTGMTHRRQALELEALGCRGYLTKPVRQSVLRDVLAEVTRDTSEKQQLITRHSVKERRFRNVSVLVADDSIVNARLTAAILKSEGYSVTVAADGVQALDLVMRQLPDVVLLDLEMPKMNGMETVRAIRHWESSGGDANRSRPMTAIAITGHAEEEWIHDSMSAGFDLVLVKPVPAANLVQALERFTGGHPPAASPSPPPQPVAPLDLARAVNKALGDHEFLESLVADFILSTDEQIDAMTEAVDNDDAETVAMGAHKIKGSAGNLYIHGVAEAALAVETVLSTQGLALIHPAIGDLKEAFEELKRLAHRPGWTSVGTPATASPAKGTTR